MATVTRKRRKPAEPKPTVEHFPGFDVVRPSRGSPRIVPKHDLLVEALHRATFDPEKQVKAGVSLLDLHGEARNTLVNLQEDWEDQLLRGLIDFIDIASITSDPERLKRIQEERMVLFHELPFVFPKGSQVVATRPDGTLFGGVVRSVLLRRGLREFYDFQLEVVATPSGFRGPALASSSVEISSFKMKQHLDTLSVRVITEVERALLHTRGEVFRTYASGVHYVQYAGNITQPSWWGERTLRADGRVVLDGVSLNKFERDLANQINEEFGSPTLLDSLPDSELWRTWPTLAGFSMTAKAWGEVQVAALTPIKFRDDAFDRLVLDEEVKATVLALVKHAGHAFSDLIDGKSGGSIFLLHGEPGTGKTLTAEAVAELLERPLYSISVGELGIGPRELEDRLRKVLDMAARWNAVVLLDEADIFLEQRTKDDIVRNAMVGVFLRLLEYHNGVMFLTTNRVGEFDRAFHSRIAIAIQYPPMDAEKRRAIFQVLLDAAGIDFDAGEFADEPVNGRQIKNAIRLAQTLVLSEGGTKVTAEHLRRTLALTTEFTREIEAKAAVDEVIAEIG